MPASSIVTSPTPDSWTMRTISRIRSARAASTPPPSRESSLPRARIVRRSGSASSPKSATSRSSSSLAGDPLVALPQLVEVGVGDGLVSVREQRDGPLHGRRDLGRRDAVAAREEVAQLVDDQLVALGSEHMEEGLRGEHLADRRGERRPAGLRADQPQLLDHLVETVARGVRAEMDVQCGDEARGEAVLGGARCDPGRERRHRLVADVLVDEVGGAPERVHRHARRQPEPFQRVGGCLAGSTVEGERDRVDGAGDQVGAGARGLDRRGERRSACALAVEADGRPLASRIASTSSRTRCGSSEPDGSWISTRAAPSSGRRRAWATRASVSPDGPGCRRGRRRTRARRP